MIRKRQTLPEAYLGLDPAVMSERVRAHKARLGSDLCILGHHYQKQEVIELSDFRGDSYALSKRASEQDAKWIVFCGVEFMAESARLLARPDQVVIHPDTSAGCPMADMADTPGVERAWKELGGVLGDMSRVIPVTYMNSDTETKAFCGRHGGAVCTSSNADRVFDWAYERGDRILFLPDEHLGRNTGWDRGFRGAEMQLYDPAQPLGGLSPDEVKQANLLLWKGFCHVHTHFTVDMVAAARAQDAATRVIVHPECPRETVAAADASGSTAFIIDYCRDAAAGSRIRIGTELNLCLRMQLEHPDKDIAPLDKSICPNMWKVSLNDLLWALDHLGDVNRVEVDADLMQDGRLALERMLAI